MSSNSCLLTKEQFRCAICLDMFTDPVTTPCGHNFCKSCITEYWNMNTLCRCPKCKEVFNMRPDLKVNTLFSEITDKFRRSTHWETRSGSSQQHVSQPGDVPCDDCSGTKMRALKSCMVCLASYCETHLEPHLTKSGLKTHQLFDPMENLEGRICMKHEKMLELFCRTDQICVCLLCTILDHRTHDVVPLEEEYEGKKAELGKTEAEIQQMIQRRRLKIEEVKRSVELSQEDADREIASGVQIFGALKETVDRRQTELIEFIKEKQRKMEKQAEAFIHKLEQEIFELKMKSSEMLQLSLSEDHLQLLQSFLSVNTAPQTRDWTGISVNSASYEGTVMRAVNQVEEMLCEQIKRLMEAELRRVQEYTVDLTLDPDTANNWLTVSDDGKEVRLGDIWRDLPDDPKRFDTCVIVLAKQSFSTGRFYYEVEINGNTEWDLGVVRESSNRSGQITPSPQTGYWTIWLRNENEYRALSYPSVPLSLKSRPEKVGVFVDYEEGLVSFYDTDALTLIYSFTGCCFNERLYPLFSLCLKDGNRSAAPLVLSSIAFPIRTGPIGRARWWPKGKLLDSFTPQNKSNGD